MTQEIKYIMSLNVRGLRNGNKRRGLFSWLKKYHNSDHSFIFLQETHSNDDDECIWEKEYGNKIVFSHGTNNSGGTAILIPKAIDVKILNTEKLPNGRCVAIEIELEDEDKLFLVNVYAPTQNFEQDQISTMKAVGDLRMKSP